MQRLDYLDALRGLAILGVILVHAGQAASLEPGWLAGVSSYGARGVQLFYMVSAFTLLTVSSRGFQIRSFFIRRFFRIAPAFYLAIVAYLLVDGLEPRHYAPEGIGLTQILLTVTFLHGWAPTAVNAIVPGGWSIACEMMFYAAFPLLLAIIRNLRSSIIAFFISCIISIVSLYGLPYIIPGQSYLVRDFAFFSVLAQAPVFMAGFTVYFLPKLEGKLSSIVCVASIAILTVLASSGPRAAHFILSIPPLAGLLWAMSSDVMPILNSRPVRALGVISFSLYLSHHLVLDRLAAVFPNKGAVALLSLTALTIMLAGILSWLIYRLIEQPGVRLGRRLTAPAQRAVGLDAVAPSQRW